MNTLGFYFNNLLVASSFCTISVNGRPIGKCIATPFGDIYYEEMIDFLVRDNHALEMTTFGHMMVAAGVVILAIGAISMIRKHVVK